MEQKLRGLVGQEMGGRRGRLDLILSVTEASSGTGLVTAPRECLAYIYLIGGGGAGASGNAGGTPAGGAGGAALYKRARLAAGQAISYSVGAGGAAVIDGVGNPGGDTTAILPDSRHLRAGGGPGGGYSANPLGGKAIGGDINRDGGGGGLAAGVGGGSAGLAGSGSSTGGGGSAGFGEIASRMLGGNGSNSSYGSGSSSAAGAPGSGSGGANGGPSSSGAGGAGRVLIVLVRTS